MPEFSFKTVLFDTGIPNDERQLCQAKFDELLVRGAYKGAHPEKLEGTGRSAVYSIRLDQKNRALFVFYEYEANKKEQVVIVLEVTPHNYDNSVASTKNNIDHLLASKKEEIDRLIAVEIEKKAAQLTLVAETKSQKRADQATPVYPYWLHNGFVMLDPIQKETVALQDPVVVLIGVAGSGKTTAVLAKLQDGTLDANVKKLLYVTQSETLVEHIKKEVGELGDDSAYRKATFSSIKTLYESRTQKQFRAPHESFGIFSAWLTEYRSSSFTGANQFDAFVKKEKCTVETLFREFRFMSWFDAQDEYTNNSENQSSFLHLKTKQQRTILFNAYEKFQQYLKDNDIYLLDFYVLPKAKENQRYSQIFLDEFQDSTGQVLRNIANLVAKNGQIIILLDPKQNITDAQPHVKRIKAFFFKKKIRVREQKLTVQHRCANAVTELAGVVDSIRNELLPKEKTESIFTKTGNGEAGNIAFFDLKQPDTQQTLLKFKDNADVCVITDKEHVDELKGMGFGLVLTTLEAKGLTFKTVVAYKLSEKPIYRNMNQALSLKEISIAPEDMGVACSQLSTVFTRASNAVYWFEAKGHDNQNLLSRFNSIFNKEAKGVAIEEKQSTKADWEKAARELLSAGLVERVKEILKEKGNYSDTEVQDFIVLNKSSSEKDNDKINQNPVMRKNIKTTVSKQFFDAIAGPGGLDEQRVNFFVSKNKRGVENYFSYRKDGSFVTTSLNVASFHVLPQAVDVLILGGADVNVKDCEGNTPLSNLANFTAINKRVRALEIALKLLHHGARVNEMNNDFQTPVFKMISYGLNDIIDLLIRRGANLNMFHGRLKKETCLFEAIVSDRKEIIELLLFQKVDVNALGSPRVLDHSNLDHVEKACLEPEFKMTALHYATYKNDPDLLGSLIEAGGNVSAKDSNGETCLEYVPNAVKLKRNRAGKNVKDLIVEALQNKKKEEANISESFYNALENKDQVIISQYLQKYTYIKGYMFTFFKPSSLYYAIKSGQVSCVEILLNGDDCEEIITRDGYKMLWLAVKNGYTDIIRLLVQKGLDVNVLDVVSKSGVLHQLIYSQLERGVDLKTLECLVELKINLNLKTRQGETALHIAVKNVTEHSMAIIEFLVDAGADLNALNTYQETPLRYIERRNLMFPQESLENRTDPGSQIIIFLRECSRQPVLTFQYAPSTAAALASETELETREMTVSSKLE